MSKIFTSLSSFEKILNLLGKMLQFDSYAKSSVDDLLESATM